MTYVYLVTIPLLAVVLTAIIVRIQALQDRIGLLQEHVNLLDTYIAERLRAKGNNYLWSKPGAEQDHDHD